MEMQAWKSEYKRMEKWMKWRFWNIVLQHKIVFIVILYDTDVKHPVQSHTWTDAHAMHTSFRGYTHAGEVCLHLTENQDLRIGFMYKVLKGNVRSPFKVFQMMLLPHLVKGKYNSHHPNQCVCMCARACARVSFKWESQERNNKIKRR